MRFCVAMRRMAICATSAPTTFNDYNNLHIVELTTNYVV